MYVCIQSHARATERSFCLEIAWLFPAVRLFTPCFVAVKRFRMPGSERRMKH